MNNAMTHETKDDSNILVVRNLKKYYPLSKVALGKRRSYVKAVDDVSFEIERGTTMGLVGESGCGKTTVGRTILRLHDVTGGEVFFEGQNLANLSRRELRRLRPDIQMIFQDPYSSLSPRMPVGEIIGEAVRQHKIVPKSRYKAHVLKVMSDCGLQPQHFYRYPHEFSGGQRQRISIARAVALMPKFIICDEPLSALDVSIQAQIINLMKDLQEEYGYTYLFISHDLSVVEYLSDTIGVMYLGNIMEMGDKKKIFENPMHPYTEALLSAVPVSDPDVKMDRIILKGDIPSPVNPPSGCKFRTRCPKVMDICAKVTPKFKEYEPGHCVACHLYSQD
ncbi:MAG: ABC transporter ATP-binding protein [Clostridiales bacterium]|jgi:peptide/nickel transport system ATP-binding protein|nr:ABC transporter ATP-binding protein [Clostridiales bacterium]MCK9349615.1 ABC transporter ATP-binding protein [Clostridiales bacterium]MDD3540978.1 ABC transporter ATP-binding protein [Eubacteriales bacterium]MDY0119273.1 ABC transporter ATP-binding protein [Clostridia bacterium]NLG30597.1 ABC transporter ATP-binding protein [Clostridiaceae bacterium]